MNITIAKLLVYSFTPVDWVFDRCTPEEQAIIGNQENLDEVRAMVAYEIEYCDEDAVAEGTPS